MKKSSFYHEVPLKDNIYALYNSLIMDVVYVNEELLERLDKNAKLYASVCNSCACGVGISSCNTTCKGCKDKGQNILEAKKAYTK